ncbi:LacI family DNA-binding transcriptional regulator [Brachybacterium sp. AOP29-B2-41]|uniref:LacI family DNA-binding transcriptional regulator n=1 Tax=Brachybacterium sp. AOP29-B2-41 TaxID=3457704 RepID=UPI0040347D65
MNGRSSKGVTIYDIARLTNLSPSTVSRGLGKPGRLNSETEQRIKDAARMLQYEANPTARALHTGRTGSIGLVVPAINHPIFADIIRGVENAATAEGLTILIAETGHRPDQEQDVLQRLPPSVDGLVLVSASVDEEAIRRVAERRPVVLINRHGVSVASLNPDVDPGYRAAVAHLHRLGHRDLAFLDGPQETWVGAQRRAALRRAATEQGMSVADIGSGGLARADGAENLEAVRGSGASAVFTFNDLIAVSILHAAHAVACRVPEEFSLVGYDDVYGADFVIPTLSTIRPPSGELGAAAIDRLIALFEDAPPGDAMHPVTFVPRDSTGPSPR